MNGLLWTAIGTKITITGLSHYLRIDSPRALIWMIPLSVIVFAGFYMMFTGVVRKYSDRITSMTEEKTSIFRTFSLKGYIVIAFMISLGIVLKRIPAIPSNFFAWFYCGLGPGLLSAGLLSAGLLSAGLRFLFRWSRRLSR